MWVCKQNEEGRWEVGWFIGASMWQVVMTVDKRGDAMSKVHWLNGGN